MNLWDTVGFLILKNSDLTVKKYLFIPSVITPAYQIFSHTMMFSVAHFDTRWPRTILIKNKIKMIFYNFYFIFLLTVYNKKITGLDLVVKTSVQAALHLPENKFSSGR